MPVILVRTVLPDEPETIIVGIQFCDKCHHFLAVTKGSFHKIEDVLQSKGCFVGAVFVGFGFGFEERFDGFVGAVCF